MWKTTAMHSIMRWVSAGAAIAAVAASSPASAQQREARRPPQDLQLEELEDQLEPGEVPIEVPARPRARFDRRAVTQLYELPFKGEDLNPLERYYRGKKVHSSGGTQKWGYDLGARKLRGGTWRSVEPGFDSKDPKNADYYVHGKPVYAMAAGKIIRCWRNAPENPRPFSSALGDDRDQPFEDREWLHPEWRNKRMPGGGNLLLVEEPDGSLVLYAHFRPGSVPSALCPHDAKLYSASGASSEADVPEAQQKTIQAGTFLGHVGNTGNSSGPHLHVHKQDVDGKPVQLELRRGLATPVTGGKADLDEWTSFRNEMIPPGPTLIWPPLSPGKEYARHGMPAGDYQRIFDWLAESGYQLDWIDAYSVGGKAFLNHIWRPAQSTWRARHLLTPAAYQAEFDKQTPQGFRPVQVESSLVGGKVRYSVILVKDKPGGYLARHGLNEAQHMAVMEAAKAKNLSPVNVSVVSVNGQRRYTVLYRAEDIGQWQMRSQISAADYQALYDANAKAGRRPYYVNAYMHRGQPFYTVIFAEKATGARKDRHGLTSAQYQAEFNAAHEAGLLTQAVSGYDGASTHRYIAFWRK